MFYVHFLESRREGARRVLRPLNLTLRWKKLLSSWNGQTTFSTDHMREIGKGLGFRPTIWNTCTIANYRYISAAVVQKLKIHTRKCMFSSQPKSMHISVMKILALPLDIHESWSHMKYISQSNPKSTTLFHGKTLLFIPEFFLLGAWTICVDYLCMIDMVVGRTTNQATQPSLSYRNDNLFFYLRSMNKATKSE